MCIGGQVLRDVELSPPMPVGPEGLGERVDGAICFAGETSEESMLVRGARWDC